VTAAEGPAASVPGRLLDIGLTRLVRRGLPGVWVRGELPVSAATWAANHHSWWDGFVAAAVLREQRRLAALLMDPIIARALRPKQRWKGRVYS